VEIQKLRSGAASSTWWGERPREPVRQQTRPTECRGWNFVGIVVLQNGRRGVAVPGHSNARTATRFGQTDAGLLCHVAASGDGRTPAAGENFSRRAKKTATAKIILGWTIRAIGV